MEYVIVVALAACFLWFLMFTLEVAGQYRAGAQAVPGTDDAIGRRLLASAKWAFILGLGLWFAYSGAATANLALDLGLPLLP